MKLHKRIGRSRIAREMKPAALMATCKKRENCVLLSTLAPSCLQTYSSLFHLVQSLLTAVSMAENINFVLKIFLMSAKTKLIRVFLQFWPWFRSWIRKLLVLLKSRSLRTGPADHSGRSRGFPVHFRVLEEKRLSNVRWLGKCAWTTENNVKDYRLKLLHDGVHSKFTRACDCVSQVRFRRTDWPLCRPYRTRFIDPNCGPFLALECMKLLYFPKKSWEFF